MRASSSLSLLGEFDIAASKQTRGTITTKIQETLRPKNGLGANTASWMLNVSRIRIARTSESSRGRAPDSTTGAQVGGSKGDYRSSDPAIALR